MNSRPSGAFVDISVCIASHSPSNHEGKYKFSCPVYFVPAVIGGAVNMSESKRFAIAVAAASAGGGCRANTDAVMAADAGMWRANCLRLIDGSLLECRDNDDACWASIIAASKAIGRTIVQDCYRLNTAVWRGEEELRVGLRGLKRHR